MTVTAETDTAVMHFLSVAAGGCGRVDCWGRPEPNE